MKKIIFYICRFIAFILIVQVPLPALAQNANCNLSEFPSSNKKLGYQARSNGSLRCEGIYKSKISSGFEILSFTRQQVFTKGVDELNINSKTKFKIPLKNIQIIGKSLPSNFYFRMDASIKVGEEFTWPMSDVVKNLTELENNIGIYGRAELNNVEFVVPLEVKVDNVKKKACKSKDCNAKQFLGRLIIRTYEDINTVYVYKQGDEDNSYLLLNDEYEAREPIIIEIPGWTPQSIDDNILQLEIQLKPVDSDDVLVQTMRVITN